MNRQQLFEQIKKKRSFLCVGLDTDLTKIPKLLRREYDRGDVNREMRDFSETLYQFNKAIIDATASYAIAFKPNMAFYEAYGGYGMDAIRNTCLYITDNYPDVFLIADAKRGDIGNTSELYARAFFKGGGNSMFDAVTLSPYMGRDTVTPFLKYPDKWSVILALTSNPSADDFETLILQNGKPLWKQVLETAKGWGTLDNTMFVVGATRAEMLAEVREIVPDHFLLVPGVGAQGGSLEEVARHGMNDHCGLLVNSSRGIIYAGASEREAYDTDPNHFATAAAAEARKMASEMSALLENYL